MESTYEMVSQDAEKSQKDKQPFNPFTERKVQNPTTDGETLTHILKASLGTGILAMPVAFKKAGLIGGIFSTLIVAFVCTHCSYILVKCAHALYYKTRKTEMNFAEVAETAFKTGPSWAKIFAKPTRYLIQIGIFVTYYGACSVYAVIVASNCKQLYDQSYPVTAESTGISIRIVLLMLLIPLILMSWIPNLKFLAPVSMIANIFMGTGLAITIYYLVQNSSPTIQQEISLWPTVSELPTSISIVVFAMGSIGVVMPLENNMKTPQHFIGLCGVLNKGMSAVTLVYALIGFLGYRTYGNDVCDNVTLSLPGEELGAKAVKILIALAVYCTFTLQFFVCLEISWNFMKDYLKQNSLLTNYILRTVLVTGAVFLAIAVPKISPFIGLIGAFCLSIVGIFVPVFIETVTFWDRGFGIFNWVAIKNVIICVIGLLALVFGSHNAIQEIVGMYVVDPSKNVTKCN